MIWAQSSNKLFDSDLVLSELLKSQTSKKKLKTVLLVRCSGLLFNHHYTTRHGLLAVHIYLAQEMTQISLWGPKIKANWHSVSATRAVLSELKLGQDKLKHSRKGVSVKIQCYKSTPPSWRKKQSEKTMLLKTITSFSFTNLHCIRAHIVNL